MKKILWLLVAAFSIQSAMAQVKSEAGVPLVRLSNGVEMPQLGIGLFATPKEVAPTIIAHALRQGYRHIDGAHAYFNEAEAGQGVRESGVERSQLWITSKLWPSDYTNADADAAIDQMLERWGTDYLDLLYIHQPVGDYKTAYAAMLRAYKAGKVRALGISNFDYDDPRVEAMFRWFVDSTEVRPHVMQVQCHPYAQRTEVRKKLAEKGIQLEAWFPLGGKMSNGSILSDSTIQRIAQAHNRSAAQIILRWHMQEGFAAIPGTTNPAHADENLNIFDFALSQAEMDAIRALNREEKVYSATYEQTMQYVSGRAIPGNIRR